MRKLLALLSLVAPAAFAGVLNVEFNFTPYVGNPAKADHVRVVAGKATVLLNNLPVAEQQIDKGDAPVLFENREIAAALWLPAASIGPALRRGKNKLVIEFVPADARVAYSAQLRWAMVTDQVTGSQSGPGKFSSTNQSDEGSETRRGPGNVIFEREFDADFAADLPWHHNQPILTLSDADKRALAALAAARTELFKPDFSAAYQFLRTANTPGMQLDVAGIRKAKILDKGYAAGLRVAAPTVDKLDFLITGNPEVIVRGKGGSLFPLDPKALARIKGDELQMGLGMVLSVLFPPQFAAVRDASGKWVIVY